MEHETTKKKHTTSYSGSGTTAIQDYWFECLETVLAKIAMHNGAELWTMAEQELGLCRF